MKNIFVPLFAYLLQIGGMVTGIASIGSTSIAVCHNKEFEEIKFLKGWQKLISLKDKILLIKRSLFETVNDQLKNISQIEHTRHRGIGNFLVNMLGGIAAYCHQPKKPSLKFNGKEVGLLMRT